MFVSSMRIAVASAAALFLVSAPASAGGLFGGDCGCCSCAAPVQVAPAPTVSVRYGVRPVTSVVAQDYYVRKRTYVPVTTYVPQPYYVVDQGPSYNVTPVSYATPSVSYSPGRYVTRWVPGYTRSHYTYRGGYYGGHRYGGFRTGHYHRGGHWHGHRHGFHRHGHSHRHFHGARVHRSAAFSHRHGAHRGGLAGGPGRHVGSRRGR